MRTMRWVVGAVAVLAVAAQGCGDRETPFERVTRLRQQYDVQPNAYQIRVGDDGRDELVLDLLVVKAGPADPLDEITFLVRIVSEDGEERDVRRVSVRVSELRAGVTEQLTAVVPGVDVRDDDQVFLEIEGVPPAELIEQYPEYRGTTSPS